MEKCVNQELMKYLELHQSINDRHQRSTGDLLAYFTHLCDVSKASDQLWHASLLNKLPSYGLPVKLCDWLADFLSGRKITVVVDVFSSSFHNINAGVPQGSVLAPILFLLHINDLLSITTNPIHSFADDSTLHAGIMSNRPISVVELERRRLAMAASLSKDLDAIAAWRPKNMVEFNASKTQYCTVSLIATAAGKKLGYLFRARKYFSPSNLLTLYKVQTRPSLDYCSHRRAIIQLIGDPALTCHPQPLSHRRAVGYLALFYRYSNGFCSSELTSIIPPLSKLARCTRGTSSSHPKAVVLHTSRTER
nr:unnamed protein product [Callosobruchus chinensis]